jgi:hypothetical protein
MALSPNYSWAEPDNSSLVKNGAADIRTLGDAIDTSVWNVGYGQAGKNKIINGDFGIWQRGTTFTSSGTYTADRFLNSSDSTMSVTRQTFTPGTAPVAGYESSFFIRVDRGAGGTFANIRQKIEDVRTFAGQTFTVSFYAKASVAQTVYIRPNQVFGSGGSSDVIIGFPTVSVTTSWARYSATFTAPSISGKTIGTGSNLFIEAFWLTAAAMSVDFWGWQVEYGSKATPFQTASGGSPQAELAMCQRYYYRYTPTSTYDFLTLFGIGASTTRAFIPMKLPVTMRTIPTSIDISTTYSLYQVSDITNNTQPTAIVLDATSTTPDTLVIYVDVASGLTQYRPYLLISSSGAGSGGGYLGASAEL